MPVTQQTVQHSGEYEVIECDCSTPQAIEMQARIMAGETHLLPLYHKLFQTQRHVFKNIVPDAYLTQFAKVELPDYETSLVDPADDIRVRYMAVGTGTTTPSASSTQLTAEVVRATPISSSVGKVTVHTLFLGIAQGNGNTFSEIGCFAGDASATANSGLLRSFSLMTPTFVKTDQKTMTANYRITHVSA